VFRPVLPSPLRHSPSRRLILATARGQRVGLALHLATGLLLALAEGVTLALVFLAIRQLAGAAPPPWWARLPLPPLPPTGVFFTLLAAAVLVQALQGLAQYINQVTLVDLAARCRRHLTQQLQQRIFDLSFASVSRYRAGDLIDHLSQGPEAVRLQIQHSGQALLSGLLGFTYLLILLRLSPWLLLLALGPALAAALLQRRLVPALGAGAARVSEAQVQVTSCLTEQIHTLRLLHTSASYAMAERTLAEPLQRLEHCQRRQGRLLELSGPLGSFVPVLVVALIAALALLVFGPRPAAVLPGLATVVIALQRLNVRLGGLVYHLQQLADNRGRLDRLDLLLAADGVERRRQGGLPFSGLRRGLVLEAVELRYDPHQPPALQQVSFSIDCGSVTALVGPSGSGKSSIADLLVGLRDPSGGRILVDGIDLTCLDPLSWRARLGVVSQDLQLPHGTVAEVIAHGLAVDSAAIAAAAARAQAAGFIEALPRGYATPLGEGGHRLSGGQRQRLCLARALLRRPELLILDEATSALDRDSERLVQDAITVAAGEMTVLVIAHRLSTVRQADRIVVLDAGRVVEQGCHDILLQRGGAYARLWRQ
jgi:subfamily B ATP-binding cassette protein MsbA